MVERQADNTSLGEVNTALECDDDSTSSSVEDEDEDDGGLGVALPSFGSVSVNNSTDIHFGNKTIYQGPVTIKQVVYATGKEETLGIPRQPLPEPGDVIPAIKASDQDLEQHQQGLKLCLEQTCRKRRYLVWTGLLAVVVVLAISLTFLLVFVSRSDLDVTDPTNVTLSGKLRILGRKDWLAQPSTSPPDVLKLPVPYVIISHTATEPCHSQAECVYIVRVIQTFHIESKGWSDIAYNFLVGGDGYVYTGRGWDSVGAHAYGYNTCSIGISLIGTFISDHPPNKQFMALLQLIEEGVRLGKISHNYKVLGHRQVSATESPGQALFQDIQTLPQWLAEPVTCRDIAIMRPQSNTRL